MIRDKIGHDFGAFSLISGRSFMVRLWLDAIAFMVRYSRFWSGFDTEKFDSAE